MEIKIRKYNKKLGKGIITINMNAAMNCPSDKLNLCKNSKYCYAKKSERIYPSVLNFRNEQELYFDNTSSKQISTDLKEYIEQLNFKVTYIRFNESGDIKNQSSVKKLFDICNNLKDFKFYMYTSRFDLNFKNKPKNLIINGSNFMLDNEFKMIFKQDLKHLNRYNYNVCLSDCTNCKKCMQLNKQTIFVLKH